MTRAECRASTLGFARPARRLAALLVSLAALLAVAGCMAVPDAQPGSSAPTSVLTTPVGLTLAPGSTEHAVDLDGRTRTYRVYRPEGITSDAPLVVMMHGGLGTARDAEAAYGWDVVADRDKVVIIYPDAVGQSWNVGGDCCGIAAAGRVDDVAFVTRAIADVRAQVPVDAKRIYATGMSAGGMMAYRLACETDMLAAIGPVAATMLGDCPNPAPMSVIAINGTADRIVPYAGGQSAGLVHIDGPPVPDVIRTWRTTARCGGEVISVDGTVATSVAQCPSDRTVKLVTIQGGGHEWPGVEHSGPLDASPTATETPPATATEDGASVDATAQVWAFFAAHHR
ncbi:MAG: alpha/beta hydrolase family esterase [Dermatophilaceae bacterium]